MVSSILQRFTCLFCPLYMTFWISSLWHAPNMNSLQMPYPCPHMPPTLNLLKLVLKVISELQIQWPLLGPLWTSSLHVTLLTNTCCSFSFHESLPFWPRLWGILFEFFFTGAISSTCQDFAQCSLPRFCVKNSFTCMASSYFHKKAPNLQAQFWPSYCQALTSNGWSALSA